MPAITDVSNNSIINDCFGADLRYPQDNWLYKTIGFNTTAFEHLSWTAPHSAPTSLMWTFNHFQKNYAVRKSPLRHITSTDQVPVNPSTRTAQPSCARRPEPARRCIRYQERKLNREMRRGSQNLQIPNMFQYLKSPHTLRSSAPPQHSMKGATVCVPRWHVKTSHARWEPRMKPSKSFFELGKNGPEQYTNPHDPNPTAVHQKSMAFQVIGRSNLSQWPLVKIPRPPVDV